MIFVRDLSKETIINISQKKDSIVKTPLPQTLTNVLNTISKLDKLIIYNLGTLEHYQKMFLFFPSILDSIAKLGSKRSPVGQCPLCLVLDQGLFVFVHTVTPLGFSCLCFIGDPTARNLCYSSEMLPAQLKHE